MRSDKYPPVCFPSPHNFWDYAQLGESRPSAELDIARRGHRKRSDAILNDFGSGGVDVSK